VVNDPQRAQAAARLRALGHEFVARSLSDEQLDEVLVSLDHITKVIGSAPARERLRPHADLTDFKMTMPSDDDLERNNVMSDSFVSGATNPHGLGASLRREGDVAIMDVTLGKAFEGAPGRAHGGVVAALIDETMGIVLAIHGVLAFTGQLDITYVAPTPVGEALSARAWLVRQTHRKLYIEGTVNAHDVVVAKASALFIAVDPTKFLEHLATDS
jgi:acyl-coenzyme A thioesterase PaaI-like protein